MEDEFSKDYFTSDTEQDYIKETGKLPYHKGDTELSDDFKAWIQKRWAKERAENLKKYKCRGYLFCMYELLELSTLKIGKECNVGFETIRRWLIKFDIKRRTKSENLAGEKHPMYGKHLSDETKRKISIGTKKRWQERKSDEAYKRFKQKRKEFLKT